MILCRDYCRIFFISLHTQCKLKVSNSSQAHQHELLSYMPPPILNVMLICTIVLSLVCGVIGHITTFSKSHVMQFINATSAAMSPLCQGRLAAMGHYITHGSLSEHENMFVEAFGVGPSSGYLHYNLNRWQFKALQCLTSAGESVLIKSRTPMHFCIGTTNKESTYSICVPSECNNDQIKILAEWQRLNLNNHETNKFDNEDCMESRYEKYWFERPLPLFNFILQMILICFILLSTLYHHLSKVPSTRMIAKLFLAFSAKTNLRKLVQMPRDAQSTIMCFFGIRFLSMVWTVVGHSFAIFQVFVKNIDEYKNDMTAYFFNQWINNFTLSVDIFFVLSGTLTAYSWFQKWQNNRIEPELTWQSWGYWLRFYRHRVVRLWPAYAFTLLAVTQHWSVSYYHKMWPPTDPSVQCPSQWWKNLLFLNSLFQCRCMDWTWYIGTEFIFYLVSPVFLLVLRWRASFGIALAAVVMGVSIGFRAAIIMAYNFPPTLMMFKQPSMFNQNLYQFFLVIYIKPHTRIGSYVVGLLLGYFLATRQKRQYVKFPSVLLQTVGWSASVVGGGWAVFGLYPALQDWDWPIYHLVYGAIHRTVFSLAIAWVIYACHSGMGGPVNTLLSHRCFIPLSSMCYGVYLFHMLPATFTYLLDSFPMHWTTKWPLFFHCFLQLCLSYLGAFIIAMVAEQPALNIEKLLLSKPLLLKKKLFTVLLAVMSFWLIISIFIPELLN